MSKKYIIDGELKVNGNFIGGKDNLVLLDNSHATGYNNILKVLTLPIYSDGFATAEDAYCIKHGLQQDTEGEYYSLNIYVNYNNVNLNDILSTTQLSSSTGEHLVNWIEDVGYLWVTIVYGNEKIREKLSISNPTDMEEIYNIQELRLYNDSSEGWIQLVESLDNGTALVLLQGGLVGEEADAKLFNFSAYAAGSNNQAGIGSTVFGLDNRAVGYISYAEGHNTEAVGEYSHAQNWTTSAIGVSSTAMGGRTVASGQYSTATGGYTKAKGDYSFSANGHTKANKNYSAAFGYNTTANNTAAFATGNNTYAEGTNSFTAGADTHAVGPSSVALGTYCYAKGSASLAAGASCLANTTYTTAIGHANVALGEGCFAIGRECVAGGEAVHEGKGIFKITEEGKGTRNFAGGLKSKAKGNQSFAFGNEAKATANYSIALGNGAEASAECAFAIGDSSTKAEATYSVALGSSSVKTNGTYGVAAGRTCECDGYAGVALGHTATSTASYAVAIGHGVSASNECAVALGHRAAASGKHAIAIGADASSLNDPVGSKAQGFSSVAIVGGVVLETGDNSVAIGQGSKVEGKRSIATHGSTIGSGSDNSLAMCGGVIGLNADYSVAIGTGSKVNDSKTSAYALGQNCVANRNYQMVVGRNNEEVTGSLFVVGGGNSSAKWNLFEAGQDKEDQQTVYAKIGKTKLYESALKELLAVKPFETTLTFDNVPERVVTIYGQDYHMDSFEGRTEMLYSHGEALTITLKDRYSSSEDCKVYLDGVLVATLTVGQSHTIHFKKKKNTIRIGI